MNAIELLESGGVIVEEKKNRLLLMDSVIKKVDRRGLLEMTRTNIKGEILHPLPDEYRPK